MERKTKTKRLWPLLLLLLLLLIGFGFYWLYHSQKKSALSDEQRRLDSLEQVRIEDSLANLIREDSLRRAREREDSLRRAKEKEDSLRLIRENEDSLRRVKEREDSLSRVREREDSLRRAREREDSLRRAKEVEDSLAREKARLDSLANAVCEDTIAPWVYPDPTGGLHFEPVKISFVKSEPCSVFVRFKDEKRFRLWDEKRFTISINEELFYYAVDSCGNSSDVKSKKYVFEKELTDGRCPEGMTFIENGANGFCIDKYEWPNKKGAKPVSNVSYAEASDSCFVAGKRLCSSNEWETACQGKYSWNYPYGQTYEQHACVTQRTSRLRSGKAGECRGWYAVYDMVGNLAEWTSTPAEQDRRFYIVKGGFWESGKRADCKLERYSYYPQNRHNPVGFRCCKDAVANK